RRLPRARATSTRPAAGDPPGCAGATRDPDDRSGLCAAVRVLVAAAPHRDVPALRPPLARVTARTLCGGRRDVPRRVRVHPRPRLVPRGTVPVEPFRRAGEPLPRAVDLVDAPEAPALPRLARRARRRHRAHDSSESTVQPADERQPDTVGELCAKALDLIPLRIGL